MSNQELLDALKTDPAEFERLRAEDPRAVLDLTGADLAGCDLRGANLAGAVLKDACLRGSNCTGVNLRFADLTDADVREVELGEANLHQSTLGGADLDGANLGDIESRTRICLHPDVFRGVKWGREELEMMLRIINENENWMVNYEIVPKG